MAASEAMFPKVLRDRPRFAAKRDFPPRVAARDCVFRQRACARRLREHCRDGCALRRFVTLGGAHVAGRHHAQAGEPDALKTLGHRGDECNGDISTVRNSAFGLNPFPAEPRHDNEEEYWGEYRQHITVMDTLIDAGVHCHEGEYGHQ